MPTDLTSSRRGRRTTAVSSVCESESCEVASSTTESRSRVRSSSRRSSSARSSARRAWPARVTNDAIVASELSGGTADDRNTSWSTPIGGWPTRKDATVESSRSSSPEARASSTASANGRTARSSATPVRASTWSPSTALRQITHPAAPVASAASRAIRSAPRSSSPPAARASAVSISAELDNPAVPSAYARKTRAAWPAATRAASRSVAPNGPPARWSSSSAPTWPSSRIGTRKVARAPARSAIRRRPGESSLTWSSSRSGGASSTREPSISAASAACPATARTTSSPRSTRRTTARSAEAAARAVSATAWSASSASAPDVRRSAPAESAVSAGVRDSTAVKTSRSSEKHTQAVKNRAKSLYTWADGRACTPAEPTNADTCRGAAGRPDGRRPGLPLLSRQAAREDRAPPRDPDGTRPLLGDPRDPRARRRRSRRDGLGRDHETVRVVEPNRGTNCLTCRDRRSTAVAPMTPCRTSGSAEACRRC